MNLSRFWSYLRPNLAQASKQAKSRFQPAKPGPDSGVSFREGTGGSTDFPRIYDFGFFSVNCSFD